jgi:N-acetylneuraminate synthase/N,N'-diacetyllegionaminate synthase
VAEIGLNHNGDLGLAYRTMDAAIAAGADAVKFQNYVTEDFLADRSLTYEYVSQGRTVIEAQYDMFKRYELSREALRSLKAYCEERGVLFHSTPTSPAGVADLVVLGVPVLKNGSDYLTHLPLIRIMGETGLPTVLSTGMATLAEIDEAVRTFRSTGNDGLVLLHCTSSYPTPMGDVHLRKIPALAAAFDCLVGFSDHSEGATAAIGAVALGACWIEKHFTLDRNLPGPDHRFSAEPAEFHDLVRAVRGMEQCLGRSAIGPAPSEASGREGFRLSCVAARPLAAGSRIHWEDLSFRRPGIGLPPSHAHLLVGRTVVSDLPCGAIIGLEACA